MPSGTPPSELVAYGRFVNTGASGQAAAKFKTETDGVFECLAPIPFTASGGAAVAWCSLGSAVEPDSPPVVTITNGGD